MKLGMRVFDKIGYESTVYSKGTDMEEAPRKVVGGGGSWLAQEGSGMTQLLMVEFCSFVALLKILSIALARGIKTIYLLWFMPWKMI